MKAVLYVRVSTDKQELEQQIMACRRYAEYKQYEILGEFSDVIGFGKYMTTPAFLEMKKKLVMREADVLVVFRWDRVGRTAREIGLFFEDMERLGIRVESVNEQIDVSNPYGRAFRDIILRLAQLERDNISEATRQRLQALKNLGKKLGRPPKSGNHLQEQDITKIRELRDRGFTIREIAKEYNISVGKASAIVHKRQI